MKFGIRSLLAAILCFASWTSARATLLAQWDFTGGSLNGTPNSSYISGTPALTSTAAGGTASASTGALVYSWSGSTSKMIGSTFVITLTAQNTVAISGLSDTATVAFTGGVTGITGTWSYSVTGGGSGSGSAASVTGSGNLGGIPNFTLNAGQTVTLTYTINGITGGGSGSQSLSFDTLQINGNFTPVPEPMSQAMAVFGLIAIGGGATRYYRRNRKAEVA